MKKVLFVLFFIFSLFSTADVKMPSNVMHSHTHVSEMGIEHIHEHSHVEVSNTLYCSLSSLEDFTSLKASKVDAKEKLNPKLIINSIFRPPIIT